MIRDAPVISETFAQAFELRTGVTMDRDLNKAADHRVFPIEVVPSGTAFAFEAVVENADETEWKYARAVLKAMEIGLLTLGGMTSRGFGGVRLEEYKESTMDRENLLAVLLTETRQEG